jgi:formylglycine-generating enzyme required for sulfatase activity
MERRLTPPPLEIFAAPDVRRLARTLAPLALLATSAAPGCKPKGQAAPTASASGKPTSSVGASTRAPKEAPLSGERVEIPGGAFFAGSVPGDPGRVPELEPRRRKIELGPYQIDRLPYPNDPALPPLTSVTREDAKRLCAEHNGRLCTEIEWERACRGPANEEYGTGNAWDARCAKNPASCASGFEVLAMGAGLAEWTQSDVIPTEHEARRAAVRGAAASAPAPAHRCAARQALDGETKSPDLGFRCCSGAPNAAAVAEPKAEVTFRKARITTEELTKLFAQDPATRELAKDVRFFKEPDSAETVVARGNGDRKGLTFSVAPQLWNPVPGAEFLLVTGRSGETVAFVAAFYVIGDNEYRLASSFIMKNEPGPVALAFDNSLKPRLHFSTCWGCPGETGKILFRKPERAVILQP